MTPPSAPPPLPPACANYDYAVQHAAPGVAPQQYSCKLARSVEGLTNISYGNQSIITDPRSQKTIVLDHLKKEAQVFGAIKPPAIPGQPPIPVPGLPSAGIPALPPGTNIKDLGKKMIIGHEAEGKLYEMPIPKPTMPPLPSMLSPTPPATPQLPGVPTGALKKPDMQTVEVWTSTKLHVPLLTKVNAPGAQVVATCTSATPCNPPPSSFQVPPDYKVMR